MKIFLDDMRKPKDVRLDIFEKIGQEADIYLTEWVVVPNYNVFKNIIKNNHEKITAISFDFDLTINHDTEVLNETGITIINKSNQCFDDKTGYDCAKWMKDYYIKNNLKFPEIYIHTLNKENALKILNVFKK